MWLIEYAYRLFTDKKVRCQRCGTFIGYVVRDGHTAWLCWECGDGQATAV